MIVGLLAGCSTEQDESVEAQTFDGQTVRVSLPDHPGLRQWLKSHQGEWEAETHATLELIDRSQAADSDLYVLRSTEAGELSDLIIELPEELLESDEIDRTDYPPAIRRRQMQWNRRDCFLPLASYTPLLYYRRDILESPAVRAKLVEAFDDRFTLPRYWDQFDRVIQLLAGKDHDGDGAAETGVVVSSWGEALLCRSLAYGKYPDSFSFYFEFESLEPLIDTDPFRGALDEWAAVSDSVQVAEGASNIEIMAEGKAVFCIGSSEHAARLMNSAHSALADKIAVISLPSSRRAYTQTRKRWDAISNSATLVDGWNIGLVRTTQHWDASVHLLSFLMQKDRSRLLAYGKEYSMGPVRRSQLADSGSWNAEGWENGHLLAAALDESFMNHNAVSRFRLVGADSFESAWNAAIDKPDVVRLNDVKERWIALIQKHGGKRLGRQYKLDLGMPIIEDLQIPN